MRFETKKMSTLHLGLPPLSTSLKSCGPLTTHDLSSTSRLGQSGEHLSRSLMKWSITCLPEQKVVAWNKGALDEVRRTLECRDGKTRLRPIPHPARLLTAIGLGGWQTVPLFINFTSQLHTGNICGLTAYLR